MNNMIKTTGDWLGLILCCSFLLSSITMDYIWNILWMDVVSKTIWYVSRLYIFIEPTAASNFDNHISLHMEFWSANNMNSDHDIIFEQIDINNFAESLFKFELSNKHIIFYNTPHPVCHTGDSIDPISITYMYSYISFHDNSLSWQYLLFN
jgi:hypothetical protein